MEPLTTLRLTDLLSEEHRLIQRGVVVLARLCAHIRRGGELDPDVGEELLRFIRQYADAHHHAKEEDILFPWMRSNGVLHESGPIEVMLSDHAQARRLVTAMAQAVEGLRVARDDERARQQLVESGEAYATLLWGHIWKEDNVLYPMAEGLGSGTAGLYDPAADTERDAETIEAEFRALVGRLETLAEQWPREDVQWPQGCH